LLANGSARLLGWFMLAATLIPVGDALIVLRSKGPEDGRVRDPRGHRPGHGGDHRPLARRV